MSKETIYRQDAIDGLSKLRPRMIDTYEKDGDTFLKVRACDVNDMLEGLPPAQPQRPKGHWIYVGDGYTDYCKCSECGDLSDYEENFCRECGSDNRGEQDE